MALSDRQFEELKKRLQQKKTSLGDEEYTAFIDNARGIQRQKAEQTIAEEAPALQQIGTGAVKGLASTGLGIGSLGRKTQTALSQGVEAVTGIEGFGLGKDSPFEGEKKQQIQEVLKPDTGLEKAGFFLEQAAEFAIPSAYAGKATAGTSLVSRMLAQGTAAGTVSAAQKGEIGKEQAITAATAAAFVPVGDLFTKGISSLSNHFPEWLVKPLVKQTPNQKLKGEDAAKLLVDSGRIGTVDNLISQTDEAINSLNTQVDDIIAKQTSKGISVNRNDIVNSIVDDINKAGGKISDTEVLGIVDNLAPQARGLLEKQTLTLQEANQLRKLLDQTLGDRAFVANQLTFNKGVLMDFTNALRQTVQSSDETLAPLYKEFSKNITLKQALNARAVAGGGANSVGFYDLLTGGAALGATGDPVTSLLAIGGRRAFESAPVKTGLAQVFKNADKVLPALETLAPAARGVILEFISSLQGNKAKQQESQATKDKLKQ